MKPDQCLIIGIGNPYRGDDAFGHVIASELAKEVPRGVNIVKHDGEPAGIMEIWQSAAQVILVDAVSSGAIAGSIFQFDLAKQVLPREIKPYSTHAFGVAQAVELARQLGRLPAEVIFIGVEGENFGVGVSSLSPALMKVKKKVIAEVLRLLKSRECEHA